MPNKIMLGILLTSWIMSGCSSIAWREGSVLAQTPTPYQSPSQTEHQELPPTPVRQRQLSQPPYPSNNRNAQSLHIQQQLQRLITTPTQNHQDTYKVLSKLSQQYPKSSGIYYHLGRIAFLDDKPLKAIAALEHALDLSSQNFYAANLLGLVYRSTGDFDKAKKAYTQAIKIWPDYSTSWYNLGILEDIYLNNIEKALIAYQNYLAIEASKAHPHQDERLKQQIQKKNNPQSETIQLVELWVKDITMRTQHNNVP